jgi:hypothetical protein
LRKEPTEGEAGRFAVKPLELRRLYQPPERKGAKEQGNLDCWVDILLPAEATGFAIDDVSLPPNAIFEVFSLRLTSLLTWLILQFHKLHHLPRNDPHGILSFDVVFILEVRVIVWKAKDVVAMDSLENMNDTYVKVWL